LELGVPKTTIQNVLHKHLRLHAYKIQLRHEIKVTDCPKRVIFANFLLSEIDDNEGDLQKVMFVDEATFHINGCVSHYNCRIWGLQQPNEFFECVHDTPKVNMWCGLLHDRVVGRFFSCVERTITGHIYLDLLEQFVFPQADCTLAKRRQGKWWGEMMDIKYSTSFSSNMEIVIFKRKCVIIVCP
jgi:hypothetical protein